MHTGTKYLEVGDLPRYIKNVCTVYTGISNCNRPKYTLKRCIIVYKNTKVQVKCETLCMYTAIFNKECIQNRSALLKKYYPSEFPPMQIVHITEGETRSIASSLKSKNSFGYDGISTKILKLCRNQISKSLNFICNKSITMGVFPERLKYALVILLHKKGDVSNMANYRPISLLPVFSNVFAKAMYYRFSHHLQAKSILATEQYGFRNGLSTEHKTFSLTDNTLMAWKKQNSNLWNLL